MMAMIAAISIVVVAVAIAIAIASAIVVAVVSFADYSFIACHIYIAIYM